MPGEPTRLSKVVAAQAACSRREAELLITGGFVRVDGQVVLEPQARVTGERVDIDAQASLQPVAPATFLLHKPAGMDAVAAQGLLSAQHRWAGDESGITIARSHANGLVDLLPLPEPASGLAVFSQDGRIVRKLQEDAAFTEQELVVDVDGTIAPDGLRRLGGGLLFEGHPLPPAKVSWQSEKRLRFAVKDIRPDVVPWMCRQVGLEVTALRRIRIGRVPMAGLPPGEWCFLRPDVRF
jgi:23S rRNA pseudouridine2604 synthase